MPMRRWWNRSSDVKGAPAVHACGVTSEEWLQVAQDVAANGGRLLALWASSEQSGGSDADGGESITVRAAFITDAGVLIPELRIGVRNGGDAIYPGLEEIFPAASRMQRAVRDLVGASASDPDRRPWLRHAAWPANEYPLRSGAFRVATARVTAASAEADTAGDCSADADAKAARIAGATSADPSRTGAVETDPAPTRSTASVDHYEFVRVQGDGVHEIPVGPVHAGTIEPGHFRFSVVGEKVLKLEERLGYVHKGIERRFAELPLLGAYRLASRISGDSAVAYSWAYCQAVEGMSGCAIPPRAAWLRALFLELERIANHLGDLGALGNDAGFAFGLMQFSRLKEQLLRATAQAFGRRYLMDVIVPGGTSVDLELHASGVLSSCVATISEEAHVLHDIYEDHSGVRDRFNDAGRLTPELAVRLGVLGLAGRASGQALDMRVDLPCEPYRELAPAKHVRNEGDVAARVAVRFDELQESCRLVRRILENMPAGACGASIEPPPEGAFGVGLIEGWRGPVLIAIESGPDGTIRRCHPHDPSWQNWPALEHAIIDNIVPDFPLINKSFNLSYSGHDL